MNAPLVVDETPAPPSPAHEFMRHVLTMVAVTVVASLIVDKIRGPSSSTRVVVLDEDGEILEESTL